MTCEGIDYQVFDEMLRITPVWDFGSTVRRNQRGAGIVPLHRQATALHPPAGGRSPNRLKAARPT